MFVLERRNQLECSKWPLTLKICQRSRSSTYYYSLCCLSAKKMTPYYILKNYFHHYIGHVEKSLSYMLCSWTLTSYKVIDKLQKIRVIGLSPKPLTLHAWKFWCKKTLISWKHCFFVVRVRWPIKELLPLKLWNFYSEI
jgi:hypothetical protein